MTEQDKKNDTNEFVGSSDRNFGLIFAAFLLLIALKPLLNGAEIRLWAVAVAGAFVALAFVAPSLLHPLNRAWMKFGMIMQKIVSPLIMGILFYVLLTPYALVARLFGYDPLKRKFNRQARTYWTPREASGPASDAAQTMRNQF